MTDKPSKSGMPRREEKSIKALQTGNIKAVKDFTKLMY